MLRKKAMNLKFQKELQGNILGISLFGGVPMDVGIMLFTITNNCVFKCFTVITHSKKVQIMVLIRTKERRNDWRGMWWSS